MKKSSSNSPKNVVKFEWKQIGINPKIIAMQNNEIKKKLLQNTSSNSPKMSRNLNESKMIN